MKQGRIGRQLILLVLAAAAILTMAAPPSLARRVRHVRTLTNVDWTSAGISGVGGGSGTISLSGVTGEVQWAFLYWHGIDRDGHYDNQTIRVNGVSVTGVALGDATTNCWGRDGSSRAFRADVTGLVSGNGSYRLTGLSNGGGHSANGASLVVVFDDDDSTNNVNIAFFEGNDSNNPEGFPGEDNGWHGVLTPVVFSGGTARAQLHAADGQSFRDNTLSFRGAGTVTIPDTTSLWDGRSVPSAGTSRASNGQLWDIHTFDISAAFGDEEGRTSLRMDGQLSRSDCLGLVLAVIETPVKIKVHSIEVTQAIQEEQEIGTMQADLDGDREPPVPIVAGKTAALRVIFDDVDAVTKLRVRVELPGRPPFSKRINLGPACDAGKRRLKTGGCRSIDVLFIPPEGDWNAKVGVFDLTGQELESYDLPFRSRKTEPLTLSAVKICDSKTGTTWNCSNNYFNRLRQIGALTGKLAPTPTFRVIDSGEAIRRDTADYDTNGDGSLNRTESRAWWKAVVDDVSDLYSIWDGLRDALDREDRRYYGIIRNAATSGTLLGLASGIPSHGAVSLATANDLGVDVSQDTVAHEVFHTMSRKHTNTNAPVGGAPNSAPGCGSAVDSSTDWPFADNRIRSGNATSSSLEVGFDPPRFRAVDPQATFDIMSYCAPVWISTFTYTKLMDQALNTKSRAAKAAGTEGEFWRVAGTIQADAVDFRPVFQLHTSASTSTGIGSHTIEVRDDADAVLFVRGFEPSIPHARVATGGEDFEGAPRFSQLVPVQAGAARLVLLDPAGAELGRVEFGGVAPTVTITYPAGGETLSGMQTLQWTIDDADSNAQTSVVQYSAAGDVLGAWRTLALDLEQSELTIDFDRLPGASGAGVIRVIASDGALSGSATSAPFSAPRKSPEVDVLAPDSGAAVGVSQALLLEGFASDPEDGLLEGKSVVWTSDLDGELGRGPRLLADSLSPGEHHITFSATDSDGNSAATGVVVQVAESLPVLDVTVAGLDVPEPSCVRVTIDAQSDLDLARIDYSLDGGDSFTEVNAGTLPHSFTVPGTGLFHLVVRATDLADQQDAFDARFFIDEACAQDNSAPVADAGPDLEAECSGGEARVDLDSSASSDPEGDALTCAWDSAECTIDDSAACQTGASCPLGVSTVSLIVSDGQLESAPDELLVTVSDTQPPVGGIVFPAAGQCLAPPVTLLDDFTDGCESELQRVFQPGPGPVYQTEGPIDLSLTASDSSGNAASSSVSFVIDGTAPQVTLLPPGPLQNLPRSQAIASFLRTSDADAAPGDVVTERLSIDGCVILDGASYGNGDGRLVDESVDVVVPLLCRAYQTCGRSIFDNPVFTAEADDCAGNTGSSSIVLPGHFVVDASICR